MSEGEDDTWLSIKSEKEVCSASKEDNEEERKLQENVPLQQPVQLRATSAVQRRRPSCGLSRLKATTVAEKSVGETAAKKYLKKIKRT